MPYSKPIVLRLCPDLHAALKQNRQMTGITVSEYCRRAIRLALFADEQAANLNADKREPAQHVEAK